MKSSLGSTTSSSPTLTLSWDSGPGTEIGSGGTIAMSRFVDAGVYMFNFRQVEVTTRPSRVRITSSAGGAAEADVTEWLPIDQNGNPQDPYFKDFVDRYLTPQELYARIEQLHAQYPELTDIVELPYKTNGYQRKSMASMCGTVGIGSSPNTGCGGNAAAVYLEAREWGHLGGNNVMAEFVNPNAASQPLSVFVLGNRVTVNLATNASGAPTSTAAQVVAAINAHPGASALLFAATYGGNAGAGVVQPRALVALSDFLPHRRRSSGGRTRSSCSASARRATARRPASSSTRRSTRVSGCRRRSISRRPSGCCATTRTTAGRSSSSTTSTSSSSRR